MNEKEIEEGLKTLLGIEVTPKQIREFTYNEWLDCFRSVPTAKLLNSTDWLQENLPIEAYAAAARWVEIIGNPHRIDKLLQTKLDQEEEEDLINLAVGDDPEAFQIALVKRTAKELKNAATSQEVARLSMNLKLFQRDLAEIRSKRSKKGSLIEKIMNASSSRPDPLQIANKRANTAKSKKTTTRKKASAKKTTKKTAAKPAPKTNVEAPDAISK